MNQADIAAIGVVLAGCLLVWRQSTRWKHRLGAFGSVLLKTPAHRALLVLVLLGILLIATVPEAAFVLPTVDAVGLDIVTILVALELRHYLTSVVAARVVSRAGDVLRTNPVLWLYAAIWPLIWLRKWRIP